MQLKDQFYGNQVSKWNKPRIRRIAADINADYLTRSDFSNQVQDSVLYYPYLR